MKFWSTDDIKAETYQTVGSMFVTAAFHESSGGPD